MADVMQSNMFRLEMVVAETYGEEQESILQTARLWQQNVSVIIGPVETCVHEVRTKFRSTKGFFFKQGEMGLLYNQIICNQRTTYINIPHTKSYFVKMYPCYGFNKSSQFKTFLAKF